MKTPKKATSLKFRLDTIGSRRSIPYGEESDRKKLHTKVLRKGLALGFRRGLKGGVWYARRHESGGHYTFYELGLADDKDTAADGVRVLDYAKAAEKALEWFKGGAGKPYTVAQAASEWLDQWKGSLRSRATSEGNIRHHILPTLGGMEVKNLDIPTIEKWLHDLAKKEPVKVHQRREPTKRLSPSRRSKIIYDANDPETIRRRKDTANRVYNDLRALLNKAFESGKGDIVSNKPWTVVKKISNAAKVSSEGLSLNEAKRFIEVCPPDFLILVQAALITGCRYDDLCKMKAKAYVERFHAVEVKQSKTGEMQMSYLTDDEVKFFANQVQGKSPDDIMFLRSDGSEWKKSHQQNRMKAALKAAKLNRPVRFHDLRHSLGQWMAEAGMDMKIISMQLGHSSVKVTEKHYVKYTPKFLSEAIRASKPSFMGVASS